MPSPKTDNDWQLHNAEDAGLLASSARSAPRSKDLRDDTWWKIGDQGATGSCVGWASADSVVRWHLVQAGRIAKNEPLSTRFPWMAAKETDQFVAQPTTFIESDGTSLKAALDVFRKWGAVRDSVLPFRTGKLYVGEVATFYAIATQLKIAAYFNLGTKPGRLAHLAGHQRPDPDPPRRRRDVGQRDGQQGQAHDVPAVHRPRWARGGSRRVQRHPVHRAQQLGHRLGRRRVRLREQRLCGQGVHRGLRGRPVADGKPQAKTSRDCLSHAVIGRTVKKAGLSAGSCACQGRQRGGTTPPGGAERQADDEHADAVVVGSGFGGSVAAYRLAEAGRSVVLLERGKAYPPGSFARTPRAMGRNFWDPSEGLQGLFDVWTFRGLEGVVSSGLGGGSLIYANVLLRKDEKWFVHETRRCRAAATRAGR